MAYFRLTKGWQLADWKKLVETDSSARWLGGAFLLFGLLAEMLFVALPYYDATRHAAHIFYYPGGAGLSIMLVIVGGIYLIAGSKARRFMPFGSMRGANPSQWVSLVVVTLVVVVAEYGVEYLFKQLGYVFRIL